MPKVQVNDVYRHLEENKTPLIVEQGGTRSGKTYNICIWLIIKAKSEWSGKTIDIVRKSFPTLRTSVMTDFFKILNDFGLYDEKFHNKTENLYKINSNTFRFFSCDDPQKMRGPGRDILFCNEANELRLEDFRQLNMRTRETTILDYNPSDEFHWIYDQVLTRDDVTFHKTTYKNNPFLPERIIREIEEYKKIDLNYWRIYGLGERGVSESSIFSTWEEVEDVPDTQQVYYGLDFGFNHPTSLVKLTVDEKKAYCEELLYKSHLTSSDIIAELRQLNIDSSATIYADCARPELIQEIYQAGFNIHPTRKGANSVKDGISLIKQHILHITKSSTNLLKEIKSYKWKTDKDGKILDEPVKINDDAVDAMRYAFNELLTGKEEFFTTEFSF